MSLQIIVFQIQFTAWQMIIDYKISRFVTAYQLYFEKSFMIVYELTIG